MRRPISIGDPAKSGEWGNPPSWSMSQPTAASNKSWRAGDLVQLSTWLGIDVTTVCKELKKLRAIRIEDLAWVCPDYTWSQILAVIKQISQSKQISLVCRRHGGVLVMLPTHSLWVQECPLPAIAMSAGM